MINLFMPFIVLIERRLLHAVMTVQTAFVGHPGMSLPVAE